MLRSGATCGSIIRGYIPFSYSTADALRDRFFSVTEATLLGHRSRRHHSGRTGGLGFWMVSLPHPLFWGTITAFASILPVLGSALVWLPAMLVLLVQGRYGSAITIAVIGGVIASNIDNLIRPLVYRRVSNIHPMITLVGAFAGVKYFGLLGLLLGPLRLRTCSSCCDSIARSTERRTKCRRRSSHRSTSISQPGEVDDPRTARSPRPDRFSRLSPLSDSVNADAALI